MGLALGIDFLTGTSTLDLTAVGGDCDDEDAEPPLGDPVPWEGVGSPAAGTALAHLALCSVFCLLGFGGPSEEERLGGAEGRFFTLSPALAVFAQASETGFGMKCHLSYYPCPVHGLSQHHDLVVVEEPWLLLDHLCSVTHNLNFLLVHKDYQKLPSH